jgi:hypothetical protein
VKRIEPLERAGARRLAWAAWLSGRARGLRVHERQQCAIRAAEHARRSYLLRGFGAGIRTCVEIGYPY